MALKNIQSAAFKNVFLRLEAQGASHPDGKGLGTVNCQFGAGPWEAFHIDAREDGSVTIRSNAFPDVYLRLDGKGVAYGQDNGGGVVNGQYKPAGSYEHFILRPQADGTVAFESRAFPGLYLRMDGRDVTKSTDGGSGHVNAQINVGPWEKFHIIDAAA
ncbi:fascin domain-containing protein [Allorhizobium undicola]|uniref:fascin domain-containing protein n=1 Tax=Allorhizobium undicola TaxID=78527 RepID=UPI0006872635|nr:hypothetical protein [Allorhizobium undicola]